MADLTRYPPWPADDGPWRDVLAPIDDELWERFTLARTEVRNVTGQSLRVSEGYRSTEQQQRFYDCYVGRLRTGRCACSSCNLAAKPGLSNHERGLAIDFLPNSDTDRRIRPIFAKYGLVFPVTSPQWEPWHTEMAKTRGLPMPALPVTHAPAPVPRKVVQTMHLIENLDGRLEEFDIFAGGVVHRWQAADFQSWSQWSSLDGLPEEAHDIAVGRTHDGRLEVVAKNSTTGRRWRRWQKAPSQAFDAWVPA